MVNTIENFISDDQINWFKEDLEQRIANKNYIEKKFWNKALIEQLYNLPDWDLQEYRIVLEKNDPALKLIKQLIKDVIPDHVPFYAAYQRQFLPQTIHVDDLVDDTIMEYALSGIIPLDPNINDVFKTVVWNRSYNTTNEMHEALIKTKDDPVISDFRNSDKYDLEHALQNIFEQMDYVEIDGAYTYKLGTLGLFTRHHAHCSSNWRKHNLTEYKDFIILHFGS